VFEVQKHDAVFYTDSIDIYIVCIRDSSEARELEEEQGFVPLCNVEYSWGDDLYTGEAYHGGVCCVLECVVLDQCVYAAVFDRGLPV